MIEVNGIVSLLDDRHTNQLAQCWRMLEERCGLKGKNTAMPPHFTWQVVERYDLTQFEPLVRALAWATEPFTIRTSGLGIFSGRSPILYVQIIKDAHLLHLHEQIWRYSQCCAIRPSPYYTPANWVPHITLFSGETTAESFSCAVDAVTFEPFEWEIRVDNLALICPETELEALNLLCIPFGKHAHTN
jgi:2'-5' RNA ligase